MDNHSSITSSKKVYVRINDEWVEGEDFTLMDSSGEWICNLREEKIIIFTEDELESIKQALIISTNHSDELDSVESVTKIIDRIERNLN